MNRRIQPRRAKNAGKTLKRLLAYLFKYHKIEFAFVLFSILVSSLANILGTYFISILIDDFIEPNIGKAHVNFTPMIIGFAIMAGIFLIGIIAVYVTNRLMINVSQGVMLRLRNEVFEHMQSCQSVSSTRTRTGIDEPLHERHRHPQANAFPKPAPTLHFFRNHHRHLHLHASSESAFDAFCDCHDFGPDSLSKKNGSEECKKLH